MGLFIPRKNPLFLVDVLRSLQKTNPDIVLAYWGKGPLKEDIVKKAQELGIRDKITFIEPVFGPAKSKIHNLADIFVHPALDEGFALAPLEAMACAKPVIMNDSHSAQEAVAHGYNGYLCKTGNSASWRNAIKTLLDNPKKRKTFSKNSLKKAKKEFNWSMAVDTHLKVMNMLSK